MTATKCHEGECTRYETHRVTVLLDAEANEAGVWIGGRLDSQGYCTEHAADVTEELAHGEPPNAQLVCVIAIIGMQTECAPLAEEGAALAHLEAIAERITELGGPTEYEIDVYSLIYKIPTGTVVADNDERWCDEGECTVAYYLGNGWAELGEAVALGTFDSITAAAKHAVELVRTRS